MRSHNNLRVEKAHLLLQSGRLYQLNVSLVGVSQGPRDVFHLETIAKKNQKTTTLRH